ncbi:MAG: hypothetical protein ACRCZ9_07105 [Fusobacteriaceae bacterium]
MDLAAKKEMIEKLVEKLEKSNDREASLRRELANDSAALERIDDMVSNGDPLPSDFAYLGFIEWREAVEKQIGTSEKSLLNIAEQRIEVEALKFYLENVTE